MVAIQKYPLSSEALFHAGTIANNYLPKADAAFVEVHHHHHDHWGWGGSCWYPRPVCVYEGSTCSNRSERNDGFGMIALISGVASLAMFYFVGANAAESLNSYRALGRLPEQQQNVAVELKAEPSFAKAMESVFAKEKVLLADVSYHATLKLAPKVALLASSIFTFFASAACASAAVGIGLGGMIVSGGVILLQNGFYSHSSQITQEALDLRYAVTTARREILPA